VKQFDELALNPTSGFYKEVQSARDLLARPIPGIMVAPEVRDDVLEQFPIIDRQLERLLGALAHAVALSELSHSAPLSAKLGSTLEASSHVPHLLNLARRDLARFVNPYCERLLEEGAVDFAELLETARSKIQNNRGNLSVEIVVNTTLDRIKDAQIQLGELAHLYRLDYGLLSGVLVPKDNNCFQGFHDSFIKRIAIVERVQELLRDSLVPELCALLNSHTRANT